MGLKFVQKLDSHHKNIVRIEPHINRYGHQYDPLPGMEERHEGGWKFGGVFRIC